MTNQLTTRQPPGIACDQSVPYDTSPTSSSSDRSPVLILGATFRYSAGVQYDWSNDFSVGAAYTLLDAGSAKANRSGGPLKGDLEGEYDTNFIHAFNLNFIYRS